MERPGVYVEEAPLPRVVTTPSSTQSYGAFLGTALQGPQDPILVRSWTDYVATFGDFSINHNLPAAVYQFFINGGTACYVARVIGGASQYAHHVYQDAAGTPTNRLDITAISKGTWGNTLKYRVLAVDATAKTFDLEISQVKRSVTVVVERFPKLTMDSNTPRYVESIVNSPTIGSKYVTVADLVGDNVFGAMANSSGPVALAAGTDVAANPTDYLNVFRNFDVIDALLIFNVPGDKTTGSALAPEVQKRGDSVILIDLPENTLGSGVGGVTGLPSDNSYAAIYYPWIYISDPMPDAPRGGVMKVPPSASAAGVILRTDNSRGVFKAPAGTSASLNGAVASELRLTNAELDTIAGMNINVIRPQPGIGITVMGARTRASDTAQYLSVRRTINWVKKKSVLASRFALFEPNTPALWEQLRIANGVYLHELWLQGGLRGANSAQAYYCKCDEDINTPTTISNGEIYIEIGIAPVFPAEYVRIRVGQFESDASVVVTEEV